MSSSPIETAPSASPARSGPRVLYKKEKRRKTRNQGGLFGNMFGSTSKSKLRRHSNKNNISEALQEAEESERNMDSEAGLREATGIPVVDEGGNSGAPPNNNTLQQANASSGSSSWSSTPPEVPYVNAGSGGNGALQQHHWMPTPEYLAASSVTANNNATQNQQQQQHRIEGFGENQNHFHTTCTQQQPKRNCSPPRLLKPKQTRFEEFYAELKDLIFDLMEYGRAKTWKKKVLAVLLCLSSVLVFYDLIFGHYIITWLHAFIVWMTSNVTWAVLAFVGIFVVATLIFIPPTLLVFGAGYAFTVALDQMWTGILAATIACFLGSALGAVIAFLRARYMMRDLVYLFSKRYPLIRVADRCLKTNGFRIMVLLRMCPILPFNGLNYICGITGVSLQDFCTSLIGILPFYVYTIILGATAGQVSLSNLKNPNGEHNSRQRLSFIILICSGVVFGVIAMVYTWRLVKTELKRELELTSEEFETLVHGHGIETVHRTSSNRVTTILSYELGGDEDDWNERHGDDGAVITPQTAPNASDYYLQDGGNANYPNNAIETKYKEGYDDEEIFWIWA